MRRRDLVLVTSQERKSYESVKMTGNRYRCDGSLLMELAARFHRTLIREQQCVTDAHKSRAKLHYCPRFLGIAAPCVLAVCFAGGIQKLWRRCGLATRTSCSERRGISSRSLINILSWRFPLSSLSLRGEVRDVFVTFLISKTHLMEMICVSSRPPVTVLEIVFSPNWRFNLDWQGVRWKSSANRFTKPAREIRLCF